MKSHATAMITLIVPTMNRSRYVLQQLNYLIHTEFDGVVIVGDSSNQGQFDQTREAVKGLKFPFSFQHLPYPGLSVSACLNELQKKIVTPYAMFIPDDDFPVPATLTNCVNFLDAHRDYSAASGVGMLMKYDPADRSRQLPLTTSPYCLRPLEEELSSKRLANILGDYFVAAYAVRRTEHLQEALDLSACIPDASFANELLPVCLLAVQGKVRQLDQLFVVRQIHESRYLLPDIFDWITQPHWVESYVLFRDILAASLSLRENLPAEKARALVKEAFWAYLSRSMENKLRQKRPPAPLPRWRQLVKRVPYAVTLRRWLLSRGLTLHTSAISPLEPASPYHAAFLPIYNIVTTPMAGDFLPEMAGQV